LGGSSSASDSGRWQVGRVPEVGEWFPPHHFRIRGPFQSRGGVMATEKIQNRINLGWDGSEVLDNVTFICPEYKEQVADGVVYLRASCHKAICVKWRGGHCRMCATDKSEQLDLLEGRS